ncbi:MAG: hypothetical protein R2744_08295 [Bacteroidales bacterium]
MKIEEGKVYSFEVVKDIDFEGIGYHILLGPDSKRYMLPSERYRSYGIATGKKINCRVDKINCKGEVFLEPEHPYYRENQPYYFEVYGRDTRVDRGGVKHEVLLVKDINGSLIPVPVSVTDGSEYRPGEQIKLMIGKIAKGNILFTGLIDDTAPAIEGGDGICQFTIRDELEGFDGRHYFIIYDSKEATYTIPCDHYRHYGLKVGDSFAGRFLKYKAGAKTRVEPVNPFFTPGMAYQFTVKEMITQEDSGVVVTVVTDEYGHSHNVDGNLEREPGETVTLLVERIRKGWPLLKQL